MSNSSQPHGLQHARLLCPAVSLGVCSNSCPLSPWCFLTISFSTSPFYFCLPSFPASGAFPICQPFISGDQSTGASASVLLMNIQGWSPLGWTDLILQSKELSSLLQCRSSKASILWLSTFFMTQFSHLYITGKTIALTIETCVGKMMSLLFNTLSRFCITYINYIYMYRHI